MKISILPGAYDDAPLLHHVLTLFDALKQQGCPLDYTLLPAYATFAETVAACANADAVLTTRATPFAQRRDTIAQASDLFASVHAISLPPALSHLAPARALAGNRFDVLIVGDRHGGLSAEARGVVAGDRELIGTNTLRYAESDIRRLAHLAFGLARKRSHRLTSVDQSDQLETMELWRDVVSEVAHEYPDVRLDHLLIEQALHEFIRIPYRFDTIVAGGSLGRMLAAQAAALTGLPDVWARAHVGAGSFGIHEIAEPASSPASTPPGGIDPYVAAACNALSLMCFFHALHPSDASLDAGLEHVRLRAFAPLRPVHR